ATPAGEERLADLGEVPLDGVERLREAPLDRLGELIAEPLQLLERPLEVLALRAQLVQALLLAGVLLLGERVDPAELHSATLQPLELFGQLLASPFRRLRSRVVEPPGRLVALGLEPGDLDVDSRNALRGLRERAAELDLSTAERPQFRRQLGRAERAAVGILEERRLEALGRPHRDE